VTDNDDFHDRGFLNVAGCERRRAAGGESDSGNKNGVPRTQSMTEFGGRRCPDLYCSEHFVLHSQRIHVDPMASLNARPVPIARNGPKDAVARGFEANGTRVRRPRRATRFDAEKHTHGATQHCVRAQSGHACGASTPVLSVEAKTRQGIERTVAMYGVIFA
jgi:hypothetical protein